MLKLKPVSSFQVPSVHRLSSIFTLYESSHPAHAKRSIVYSQGLRIKRICLRIKRILRDTCKICLVAWHRNRAYPTWLIEKVFRRVREYNIQEDTSTLLKSCKRGVPFTITFHSSLKHFGLVFKKNLYILYLDTEARKVFTPESFIAFRTGRNLKNYLVGAKVPPLVREKGCKKCNKPRCLICKNI